jgi:hypothetical protein
LGGLAPDVDAATIEACRTRTGTHCVNLGPPPSRKPYDYGFNTRPVVISTWVTGWYLFGFDQRWAGDADLSGFTVYPVHDFPPYTGPTIARSAPLGPVRGPRPPRIRFLRSAIVRDGRVLVASFSCVVRCTGTLAVYQGGSGPVSHVSVTGSQLVGVPRGQLHPGELQIVLYTAGPLIYGKTMLRSFQPAADIT